MRKLAFLFAVALAGLQAVAQTDTLNLRSALVISRIDNQEDRYTLEVAVSEILSANGIPNGVSLNLLKQGGDPQILMSDSITRILEAKGIHTLMLVSIRGYDRRYKPTDTKLTLAEDLAASNLFTLYKEDIVSVTLEFHFYRHGVLVGSDLLKIGGVSSRDGVIKKLRKKLPRRIRKWK